MRTVYVRTPSKELISKDSLEYMTLYYTRMHSLHVNAYTAVHNCVYKIIRL